MSLSFEIFELTEFPVVVTTADFKIIYKNSAASVFSPKFRQGSKITKYTAHQTKNPSISEIKRAEFITGTPYKRAVVSSSGIDNTLFFLFISRIQFDDCEKFINYIEENHNGDFVKFYISAYTEYINSAKINFPDFERKTPARLGSDLIYLLNSTSKVPDFIRKDAIDITYMLKKTVNRLSSSLRVLGIHISEVNISEKARFMCICKVDPYDFSFIIMRMIYLALKFSSTSKIHVSIDYINEDGSADICVSTKSSFEDIENEKFIAEELSKITELSFEYKIFSEIYKTQDFLSFDLKNSLLKINYKIPCADYSELLKLRASASLFEKRKTRRLLSIFAKNTKELIEKNIVQK